MNPTIPLRIHVEPERLRAAPAETVQMALSVFNTSDIIDGFDITVIGADQSWVVAEPDWISLFPDSEGSVILKVTLPADFPAGPHELGIKVTSRTTNEVFAVGAVAVEVSEKTAARVDVEPDTILTGRRGRFSVLVHNDGNVPLDVAIDAEDDGNVLAYDVTPARVQLGPGQSRTCQLVVTAPRPITGTPAVRPFIVSIAGPGVELATPATISSRPWIPRWLLSFLAIALLLGLWAFIVGLAIDAIMEDSNQDMAEAFEQGIASVIAAVAPGAGGDPGDVITGPPGAVPGLVTAASDGTPVAGATATAAPLISAGSRAGEPDLERDPIEVASDDTGTFLFEDMVRGSYDVTISAPGYVASDPVRIDIPFDGEPVAVELVGAPGLVSGVVLAGGEPLPEASVLVRRLDPATGNAISPEGVITEEPLRSTITPESGRFAIDELPTPATYELDVSSPGFMTMRVIVDLTPGQRVVGLELELAGAGAGSLVGSVTDATTGDPLGGVSVAAAGDGVQITSTTLTAASGGGAVGSYRLGGLPVGEYTATFSLTGYDDVALPFTITTETPTVSLSPAMTAAAGAPIGSVSGTVVDATSGAPLGGASVSIAGEGGQFTISSLTQAGDGLEVGSLRLRSLPTGSYTATVTLANYEPVAIPFTLSTTSPTARLTARMQLAPGAPIGQLTGTVTDSLSGAGLGGVTVTVTGEGIELTTVTFTGGNGTGGNGQAAPAATAGSFALSAIPSGSYTATFTSPTHQTAALPFTVTADDPNPALSPVMTPRPTTVTGTTDEVFTGEGGTSSWPLAGVTVRYKGETLATSDGEGRFSVVVTAPAGPAAFTFVRSGYLSQTVTGTIVPGTPLSLGSIQMLPVGPLSGTFVDAFGRNLGGPGNVTLTVTDIDEEDGLPEIDPASIPPYTQAIGDSFTYPDLPGPATYTIRATFGPGTTPFRQVFSGAVTFTAYVYRYSDVGNVILPYAPRVIYGTLSCFGYPFQGIAALAVGTAAEGGPWVQRVIPDNQGRVVFPRVATGTYMLGYTFAESDYAYPTFPRVNVTVPNGPVPAVNADQFCNESD